jgi:hypothetical protein
MYPKQGEKVKENNTKRKVESLEKTRHPKDVVKNKEEEEE